MLGLREIMKKKIQRLLWMSSWDGGKIPLEIINITRELKELSYTKNHPRRQHMRMKRIETITEITSHSDL